jgi:probable selenium-dependent hydroxylase accessory protein YqeC
MKRLLVFNRTSLSRALGILPGLTAIVGSGGKTSLMLRLAAELIKTGTVIVSASTHIYPPEGLPLATGGAEQIAAALEESPVVCAGSFSENGKLTASAVPFSTLASLADYLLVEADGSRRLPLKAHAPHEPAVPGGARIIAVVGASGFGRPIAEAAHRPERYAGALGVGMEETVTPELAAKAVREHFPGGTVVVNQVDDKQTLALAARFAKAYGNGTVVAAALREKRAVKAIWRE